MGSDKVLPKNVMRWFGFLDTDGWINRNSSLTRLNDNGKTFEEIADVIESEPNGLFKEKSKCQMK